MHSRRELLKSTAALMAAALWGAGPPYRGEEDDRYEEAERIAFLVDL